MRSRTVALLGVTLLVVAMDGCGSTTDRAQRAALAALSTPRPATTTPRPTTSVRCAHPTASLRPPAALPRAGAMPSGSFMARIRRRGYLIAGVDQNTLLFAYFNPLDHRLEGFEIDLLRRLAQAIFGDPSRIQFKAVTTAERLPAVQDGSVDVVADATTITCQRLQQVDFSSVYFDASQRVLVPSGSSAGGLRDLAHRRVCATSGSTSAETIAARAPAALPYLVAQRTDCLVALQQGLADAVSTDDAILLGFKAQDPYTKIVGPRLADEPYGMVISQAHPEFVRFVNGVLAAMRADGSWRATYARWLGRYSSGPTPAPPRAEYRG